MNDEDRISALESRLREVDAERGDYRRGWNRSDEQVVALKAELGETRIMLHTAATELDAALKDAERLRKALKYYAHAKHLVAPDCWDSCSGEHSMWQFPDHDHMDETMVEGGWIAAQALDGKDAPYLTDDGDLIDDEDAAVDAAIAGSGI